MAAIFLRVPVRCVFQKRGQTTPSETTIRSQQEIHFQQFIFLYFSSWRECILASPVSSNISDMRNAASPLPGWVKQIRTRLVVDLSSTHWLQSKIRKEGISRHQNKRTVTDHDKLRLTSDIQSKNHTAAPMEPGGRACSCAFTTRRCFSFQTQLPDGTCTRNWQFPSSTWISYVCDVLLGFFYNYLSDVDQCIIWLWSMPVLIFPSATWRFSICNHRQLHRDCVLDSQNNIGACADSAQ